jgi:hypothetical protein
MLTTQEFLRNGKTLANLGEELGIISKVHPTLPLVLLNYSQLNSPKLHPIIRECRCLVLELNTWNLVSRSFFRFYNFGEALEVTKYFNWSDFSCMEKVDGSLVNLFYYGERWIATTRGSWAEGELAETTWANAFLRAFDIQDLQELDYHLPRKFSYALEFCSPFNKVVRHYHAPNMYLLSAFDGEEELNGTTVKALWEENRDLFSYPQTYHFHNIEEIQAFIYKTSLTDKTWEGIVCRDNENRRIKVKSPTYLALHHLHDNGNIFLTKNLIPIVLAGEIDEILVNFPEVSSKLNEVKATVDKAYKELEQLWESTKLIENQREFAEAILSRTKLASILFTVRKTRRSLEAVWSESADLLLKVLFGGEATKD